MSEEKEESKEPQPSERVVTAADYTVDGDGSEGEDYVVEKVLARRVRNGKVQYKLKWVGYPLEEATWEDESGMNCPELIEEFNRENEQPKEKKRGRPAKEKKADKEKAEKKEKPKRKLKKASAVDDDATDDEEPKKKPENEAKETKDAAKAKSKTEEDDEAAEKAEIERVMEKAVAAEAEANAAKAPPPSMAADAAPQATATAPVGYDNGDIPERIIGACIIEGALNLYVGWKGRTETSFVPSKVMRNRDPQMMIDYYESKLKFEGSDSSAKKH